MDKYIGMIILKPDIKKGKIDFVQSNIINLFKQTTKVERIWYLGKRQLDYKTKKYSEGIYLKIEILAKDKKIEKIKEILRQNENVIFSIIMNNESEKNTFPVIKKKYFPMYKAQKEEKIEKYQNQAKKVYMLINKNKKLPFSEADILVISTNIENIFLQANKKIEENVFVKGYYTTKKFRNIKDVETEFKRNWKVEFVLGENSNVGQQLLIQERELI